MLHYDMVYQIKCYIRTWCNEWNVTLWHRLIIKYYTIKQFYKWNVTLWHGVTNKKVVVFLTEEDYKVIQDNVFSVDVKFTMFRKYKRNHFHVKCMQHK